jgi:hypothetical protein
MRIIELSDEESLTNTSDEIFSFSNPPKLQTNFEKSKAEETLEKLIFTSSEDEIIVSGGRKKPVNQQKNQLDSSSSGESAEEPSSSTSESEEALDYKKTPSSGQTPSSIVQLDSLSKEERSREVKKRIDYLSRKRRGELTNGEKASLKSQSFSSKGARQLRSHGHVELKGLLLTDEINEEESSEERPKKKRRRRKNRKEESEDDDDEEIAFEIRGDASENESDYPETADLTEAAREGTYMYCYLCQFYRVSDDFSANQKKNPYKKYCLIHRPGMIAGETYIKLAEVKIRQDKCRLQSDSEDNVNGSSDYEGSFIASDDEVLTAGSP